MYQDGFEIKRNYDIETVLTDADETTLQRAHEIIGVMLEKAATVGRIPSFVSTKKGQPCC